MSDKESFRGRVVTNLGWSLFERIVLLLANLIVGIVLARILVPADFGLIGMITVITGFSSVLLDFGLGNALIQRKSVDDQDFSNVFWINVVVAMAISATLYFCAPFISALYNEPKLTLLTQFFSTLFIIQGFSITQLTKLRRDLKFKTIAVISAISAIGSGIIAIFLALNDFGVWSLAWRQVLGAALTLLFTLLLVRWIPSIPRNLSSLKPLLGFGIPLFGSQSVNYWTRNIDNLLIGKFLGDLELGVYSRAYAFMLLPVQQLSQVITKVMFPSLSTLADDLDRVRQVYLRVLSAVSFISFPAMLALGTLAEPFVYVLLGVQWAPMIPVLRILSVVGALQSIGSLNGIVFMTLGRTGIQFRVGLLFQLIIIVLISIGLIWGIEGVAWLYSLGTFVTTFAMLFLVSRITSTNYFRLLKSLLPATICSLLMVIVLVLADMAFISVEINLLPKLICLIAVGLLSYLAFSFGLNRSVMMETIGIIGKRLRPE